MIEADARRKLKVGLFTAGTAVLLGLSILALGEKQGLFLRYHDYSTRFRDVGGLAEGAPVWLDGVVAGSVRRVVLPADPTERDIVVHFRVESRLAGRIRDDSRVRLRTLGLLGDRFLDISSGSPDRPVLPPNGFVPSREPTDVGEVFRQGGDVVTNVLAISASLRRVLDRVDRGEGILGELTVSPESGERVIDRLTSVLEQTDEVLRDVRDGRGIIGRLVVQRPEDERLFAELASFLSASKGIAESLRRDLAREDSLLAALLRDPQARARLEATMERMAVASAALATVGEGMAEGKGTLGRLTRDQAFAETFLDDLGGLARSLRKISEKLDQGQGSAGKLLNDPTLYEDLEHMVRGVNQSRALTWLIRNRRAAGERAALASEGDRNR